jgi:hypothetical protein
MMKFLVKYGIHAKGISVEETGSCIAHLTSSSLAKGYDPLDE